MMKIAIFGGSFNPIHNAHIKLAQSFVDEVVLDRVVFVPTNITPLKDNSDIADSHHRLNMCKLATREYDYFEVSDFEVSREGLSYSCDTIAHFKNIYPDAQIYFILGADMFLTLEKWHNFEYIFKNAVFLTAPRDDCSYEELDDKLNDYQKYGCKAYIAKDFIEDLSSTLLRGMINEKQDVSCYLNKDVISYIEKYDLYR